MARLLLLAIFVYNGGTAAQHCIHTNSNEADGLPFINDPSTNAPRIQSNPIQAIIKSYQFHCCGIINGWSALVQHSTSNRVEYGIHFQIWRPENGGDYVKVGENEFLIEFRSQSGVRVIDLLPESMEEQLHFQPGDVLGYYLEQRDNGNDGGIQLDSSFSLEEVWYATDADPLEDKCRLNIGTDGDLSMSTNLGPIISVSLATTIVQQNCPSTFTSTMLCITPPSPLSTTILTTTSTPAVSSSEAVPPSTFIHTTSEAVVESTSPAAYLKLTPTPISSAVTSAVTSSQSSSSIVQPTADYCITTLPSPTESSTETATSESTTPSSSSPQAEVLTAITAPTVVVVLVFLAALVVTTCVVLKKRASKGKQIGSSPANDNQMVDNVICRERIKQQHNRNTSLLLNPVYGGFPVQEMANYPCSSYETIPVYDTPTTPVYEYVMAPNYSIEELEMIRNEAYGVSRGAPSDNEPSIPTTENEAYTGLSVSAIRH